MKSFLGFEFIFSCIVVLLLLSCLKPPLIAATQVNDWSDLEDLITLRYDQFSHLAPAYPPGTSNYGLSYTPVFFNTATFHTLTNAAAPRTILGVPAWSVKVCETQSTTRVWAVMVDNAILYHVPVPHYDPQIWTRNTYGAPPDWLIGEDLILWYRERARDRMELLLTLIPVEFQSEYEANLAAAANNLLPHSAGPATPTDTNRIAFAGVKNSSPEVFSFDLYSPGNLPIDIFFRVGLRNGPLWNYAGTVQAIAPFTPSAVIAPTGSLFLHAARGNIDSDGDGIPDGMETLHFGTNPHLWDSSGDGLSDWIKIYRYGLDPLQRDSDGDGYSDDEELLAGTDPTTANPGAHDSIRYYYDEDDRLTGGYLGADAGATTATLTPAGNPVKLQERGQP